MFAKFAFGIYSTDPGSTDRPTIDDVSDEIAAAPRRAWLTNPDGPVRVESYTVDTAAGGRPSSAIFSTLTAEGARVWAASDDPALMAALLADEEACGRDARVSDGRLELL
jgi:hypothetical protein